MSRTVTLVMASIVLAAMLSVQAVASRPSRDRDEYLSWPMQRAQAVGEQAYKRGRVGGFWDARLLKTERAYNYKLAATILAPTVIRASARMLQIRSRLSPEATRELVGEAERRGGTTVMVEIDPREGSGVIPLDWEAFLQPQGRPQLAVKGVDAPELRDVKALAGVLRRNYDYDRFWRVFPATGAYAGNDVQNIELVVRIHDQEGRVQWPSSILRAE